MAEPEPKLTAVAQFFRSPRVWIILGFGLLVLVILSVLLQSLFVKPENIWRGIKPGETNRAQVIAVIGNPVESKTDHGYLVEAYKGDSQFSEHAVFYQGDIAVLVKEGIAEPKAGELQNLTDKYGNSYVGLYGPGSNSGFYYYAYFDKGILVVANSFDGTVYQIWYFVPTTLSSFLSEPGFELSASPPEE